MRRIRAVGPRLAGVITGKWSAWLVLVLTAIAADDAPPMECHQWISVCAWAAVAARPSVASAAMMVLRIMEGILLWVV